MIHNVIELAWGWASLRSILMKLWSRYFFGRFCYLYSFIWRLNKLSLVYIQVKWLIKPVHIIPVSVATIIISAPGWILVHHRVTSDIKFASAHLYTWVDRVTVGVKVSFPVTQHNDPSQGLKPDHIYLPNLQIK